MNKSEIRNFIKAKRNNLSEKYINEKSKIITNNLLNTIPNLNNVLVYKSFNKEVNTSFIINHLLTNNKKVFLPRIKKDSLEIVHFNKNTKLVKNIYNIEEPTGESTTLNTFICIVPLIAVDKKGNRIGFGKGYYDNFLKNKKCLKIGICYDFQIVKEIQKEPQDIALDIIISENNIIKIN